MQSMKLLGAATALIVAALVGGTLIGSVLAAPGGTGSSANPAAADPAENAQAYCQTFLDTFASELGVSTDDLAPAAKAAAIAAVNAAVDAGDLTQDQADSAIERINAWDGEGCGLIGWHLGHIGQHAARVEFMQGMFTAAADALNMTTAELRDALTDNNLQEVADAQNVDYDTVVAAALASAKTDLDAAVTAGTITQDKADAIYSRLETWLNDGGPGGWGDGPFHRGPFAPAPSDAPASDSSTEGTSA
jgi:hypothetical protein